MELRHFTLDEFDSPDSPGSGRYMDEEFLELLDEARHIVGKPFRINSGYRTKKHNKKVGGVEGSSHTKGYAADIHCTNNETRALMVEALMSVGFERLGISKSFIHVDNDQSKPFPRIWLY